LALAQNPRLLLLDEPLAGLSTEERETVRFAVPKGKILGLLGRNGVGKTTCISTIAGMMRARGGTILLGDRRVESSAPKPSPAPASASCRKAAASSPV
jgi:ABC-type branched-subunit amino acid transport system ATPase component